MAVDFNYLIPQGPYVCHPCDLTEDDILNCPYNAKFAREIVAWLSKLQWPVDDCEATGPDSLISFILISAWVQVCPHQCRSYLPVKEHVAPKCSIIFGVNMCWPTKHLWISLTKVRFGLGAFSGYVKGPHGIINFNSFKPEVWLILVVEWDIWVSGSDLFYLMVFKHTICYTVSSTPARETQKYAWCF